MDLLCPKCGSLPADDIQCLDGGNYICSKCPTHFHYCEKINKISEESPINCCIGMNKISKAEAIQQALEGCDRCKFVPTLEMINTKKSIKVCYNKKCLENMVFWNHY